MSAVRPAGLLAFALMLLWGAARAEPAMWRVTGPKGTAILFGSIHLLPAGLDWRTAALTKALTDTDELWFEIAIGGEDDARAADLLLAKGRLPAGDSLAKHLPPGLSHRLDQDAIRLGIDPTAINAMKPWLADATLSIASDARSGAQASQGVERQIDDLTPVTTKRRALETAADQIGILAGGPIAEQVDLLAVTLDEVENQPDRYSRVVKAWVDGDVATVGHEALDPLRAASPRAYRALITDRNRRWVREIEHRLLRGGSIVVVVGVGHLIGPKGVPALLRADRWNVEGPSG